MARDTASNSNGPLRAVLSALAGSPDAVRLAELIYGNETFDAAAGAAPEHLAADARETLAFISEKASGRHKLRVRASAAGGATLVEILNDDMPFLVDSVMAEIQARGLGVRMVAHPIVRTARTPQGRLKSILGLADPSIAGGGQESLIIVALDPLSADVANDLGRALSEILGDVRLAVGDWPEMVARVDSCIGELSSVATDDASRQAGAFLRWLREGHFIFLGLSELRIGDEAMLKPVEGSARGLLRDPSVTVLRRSGQEIALTRETGATDATPVVVSKASAQSRVHRRVHMDYIAVKTAGATSAAPAGELRIVGLFTSKAYTTTARQIPLLGHKIETVLAGSGYPPQSHSGKALVNILDTFPRDELFQIGADDLAGWSSGILDLEMRPRVRVFARPDRFQRFISVLLYAPRERWTTTVRERVGALFADACRGRVAAFTPFFLEGPLLRAHFIVATPNGPAPALDAAQLEARITEFMRTWDDDLAEGFAAFGTDAAATKASYGNAFPRAYADTFDTARAVEDIRRIERLAKSGDPVAIDFYRAPDAPPTRLHAAIYRFGDALRLSDRVPVLENLGFTVIDERSYRLTPTIGGATREVALHDMVIEAADGAPLDLEAQDERLEDAFRAVVRGAAESDPFNRLVIASGADWREAALMRAYASYLRQINAPFGLRYLAETMHRHAGVVRDLIELFHVRFDPDRRLASLDARAEAAKPVRARIEGALATIPSADEDRILRLILNVMDATIRTNFFQMGPVGAPPDVLAVKLDTKRIESAPAPRPYREIWVYSPRVEGVHLRFAPIARGGIRWSDRAQDFRTEVLGLVKAQLVKNAVIVPSGAKGGFLPKHLPRAGTRDEIMKEGVAAYRLFIGALLDVTDNIVDGALVPPPRVVRHDGDDAYLVVAADKGTATFSDFANEISAMRGHWLGDAFASGGSVGYDHKKMAITARGAWECVKRHFREMDWDIQTKPFRVVGVGDMSGDVFGNGMLLSPVIRLVAAFDHRDIFIDPDPDAATSIAERRRLFDLPRSSWQDYDKAKISKGGGVFSRGAKTIPLSVESQILLGLTGATATPAEIMRAILKCESDLCWFGGIGTYVRASTETDDQVGDRATDAIRVTGLELGAKVVGEGANLGLTQRGRMELAARGVRLNTDFIDNSAGVNSSDVEVNIKIALGRATRSHELSGDARGAFLASMTDEVAVRCLANNTVQSLALSLAERRSGVEARDQIRLMHALEQCQLLDRKLEALPGDTELSARQKAGKPLTRPELAVLLSYSKIALTEDLIASDVPDLPATASLLTAYMPKRIVDTYPQDVETHRLRREIIATAVTNAVINHLGAALPTVLATETGCSTADVVKAYLIASRAIGLASLGPRIDALDNEISGGVQLDLYATVQHVLRSLVRELVRERRILGDVEEFAGRLARTAGELTAAGSAIIPDAEQQAIESRARTLTASHVPRDLADALARLPMLADLASIDRIASEARASATDAARAYFALGADLHLTAIKTKAQSLQLADDYDAIAMGEAVQQLNAAHARFTRATLSGGSAGLDLTSVRPFLAQLASGEGMTVSRLVVAASRLRDVAVPSKAMR